MWSHSNRTGIGIRNMRYYCGRSDPNAFGGGPRKLWEHAGNVQKEMRCCGNLDSSTESYVDMGSLTKFKKEVWGSLKDSPGAVMYFNEGIMEVISLLY